ncbi:Uncharacterized protein BP5553_06212 [Venustampulla echinocandica]|uniref:Uncharacterized protein n=1 Tax=Venustampulla echinocandica TaxID=2656787 RepID=A0A370TMU9_9HELO|nr:Uncharacterized protein BP5553_06212 [Venustampulla echinocandica]RDL36860.1 Uncharacterized protein BP5553_06212 [Venustampulla echinocandica]
MSLNDFDYDDSVKTLITNFNALADEVQLLSDRNTILQYKLQYAHSEYQTLADKYAPSDPEISSILAKLQLPPDQVASSDRASFVPLPLRKRVNSKQQTAVAIRDGRKAAQRLTGLGGKSTGFTSISGASSNMRLSARRTSLSTVLEQDFTVPGKKSSLECPFAPRPIDTVKASSTMDSAQLPTPPNCKDPTPHKSADPICAAMYAETMNSPPPSATGSAAKCPIRYLDQHSPEEVARYFQSHKHEIPRSHEICVKRYQRNEEDIRKLDAKYGNMASMIQGLGETHQPMLPSKTEDGDLQFERTSTEMVENWANAVSADGLGQEEEPEPQPDEDDRESRFDRPLKEIRVGESPSRPWGISVPIFDPPAEDQSAASPPPAPVSGEHIPKPVGKCPFGHGQGIKAESEQPEIHTYEERPVGKCPFGAGQKPQEEEARMPSPPPAVQRQPAFIQPPNVPQMGNAGGNTPQMIFTGPVFIGYPMDDAIRFMQQYKGL